MTNSDRTEETLNDWDRQMATIENEDYRVETGRYIEYRHPGTTSEANDGALTPYLSAHRAQACAVSSETTNNQPFVASDRVNVISLWDPAKADGNTQPERTDPETRAATRNTRARGLAAWINSSVGNTLIGSALGSTQIKFLTPRQVRGVHTGAENRAGVERTKGGTGGGRKGDRIVVAALQPPAHPTGRARALRIELARITDDHDEGPPFGGQTSQG